MALPKLSFLLPNPPADADKGKQHEQLRRFANQVLTENATNLVRTGAFNYVSFWVVFVLYCLLFLLGFGTAIAAVIRGFQADSTGAALGTFAIAGVSAASFFALTITRPLESLERNTIYSSWLATILNTYWTRLLYFSKPETIDTDLQDATEDLVKQLTALADQHSTAIGKYTVSTGAKPTTGTSSTDTKQAADTPDNPALPQAPVRR